MTQYFGIDWLAMCLTFTAIYLLGNKSRYGFLIMMFGNLCWSAIGVWLLHEPEHGVEHNDHADDDDVFDIADDRGEHRGADEDRHQKAAELVDERP